MYAKMPHELFFRSMERVMTQRNTVDIVAILFILVGLSGSAAAEMPGVLYQNFGPGGFVEINFHHGLNHARDVAIQSDGKIVVVGQSQRDDNDLYDFALARFNSDGSLDQNFGTEGLVITTDGYDGAAIAIQPDGKIVVAGSGGSLSLQSIKITLARYLSNGDLDSTFGTDGLVIVDTSYGVRSRAADVIVQENGNILIAGWIDENFCVARFDSNGTADPTFAGNGRAQFNFGGAFADAKAMVVQDDGKIVVAGRSNNDFALARLETDGTMDTTFSVDGKVVTDFAGFWDSATGLAVLADGKIIVSGFASVAENVVDFALARFTSAGSLDASFGTGGLLTTDVNGDDYAHALAVQDDGKYIVGGGSNNNFAVVRYNIDGSLVPSLGTGGIVINNLV